MGSNDLGHEFGSLAGNLSILEVRRNVEEVEIVEQVLSHGGFVLEESSDELFLYGEVAFESSSNVNSGLNIAIRSS